MSDKLASLQEPESVRTRESTGKRRREILGAALKCFLLKGVSDTTIKDIQAESGASSGSIYHLFRGKDEIAMTLFVEGMTAYHTRLTEAMGKEPTALGCICAIVTTHIDGIIGNPPLAAYLTRMSTEDPGEIGGQYQTLNDKFAEAVWSHLKPFVEKGGIVCLPGELYYPLIIGPTAFLCRAWLRNPDRSGQDLESAAADLVRAAWKSLQV